MTVQQQSSNSKNISKSFFKKNLRIDYGILCLILMILISLLIILYTLKTNDKICHNSSPLLRQTTHGPVEGVELTTSLGQKYYAFRGIPFAEPPITGIDPYTGEQVDRRFKVRCNIFSI